MFFERCSPGWCDVMLASCVAFAGKEAIWTYVWQGIFHRMSQPWRAFQPFLVDVDRTLLTPPRRPFYLNPRHRRPRIRWCIHQFQPSRHPAAGGHCRICPTGGSQLKPCCNWRLLCVPWIWCWLHLELKTRVLWIGTSTRIRRNIDIKQSCNSQLWEEADTLVASRGRLMVARSTGSDGKSAGLTETWWRIPPAPRSI